MAVPSHGYRAVLEKAAPFVPATVPVVSLAKGIEQGTLLRMSEVTLEVLPDHVSDQIAVLTGPNLAREVAIGQPAASVIACGDPETARDLQQLCMSHSFRVYTNPDVIGCEVAGALKNVIAIAAGTAAGLGYGDNTVAALITRGLAELARLGVALGGEPLTFAGLAGLGDLVATCTSPQSRNRSVGFELGRGRSLDDIVAQSNDGRRGRRRAPRRCWLWRNESGSRCRSRRWSVRCLYHGRRPAELVPELMLREAKAELDGLS